MAALSMPPTHQQRDPSGWTVAVALVFLALILWRLTIPSKVYFDEVHYVPAARILLELEYLRNPEHPPLAKELIALGIAVFGDKPLGWRIMPALFGVLGLYAAMRAMWFASLSRFATLAFGVLLATSFPLFVQARIAMLDGIMCGFALLGLWMCAGAFREHETARWRLAIAGAAFGCALASKWNALPVAVLPGLAFLAVRARSAGWRFLWAHRGPPVGGMTLAEAGVWLGLLPIAIYALTFAPYAFLKQGAVEPTGLIALHQRMLTLQEEVLPHHTYQSVWYEWVLNWRAIWYFYEPYDGAQRGVLMVGNPLTMLIGLPAVLWCGWAGIWRLRWDALGAFTLYAATLGFWVVAQKAVQFYYHYLLSSVFLIACLALTLDALWRRGWRWIPLLTIAVSVALFAFYWPILTAAKLHGPQSFLTWTWLHSWR